jgi:uncharacterized protein
LIALLHSLAAFALALVQGVTVPRNDGWVTDLAGLLKPDQERALEALCESYRAGTKHDVAVLTVPDLGGQPLERFALEVARDWKLGQVGVDDGALLLVSKNDRKIRIEVLRGLEHVLTDSISGRIIRDEIAPHFKSGDFYGGLRAGLEAMHAAIGGEYGRTAPVRARQHREVGQIALSGIVMVVFILIAISRSRRRGGGVPWWIGPLILGNMGRSRGGSWGGGGFGGGGRGGGFGGFGGFGGGGGARGGGASGGW